MPHSFLKSLLMLISALTILTLPHATRAESFTRPRLLDGSEIKSCGGEILRIPGFDFREAGLQTATDGRPVMERDDSTAGKDGFACYRLRMTDRRFEVYDDWSFGSKHTIPLKPNRSYIVSILLDADFERPAEINAGLKTLDASGKQVIWNLNGLPAKTDGWRRWQWEFTTDPRVTHGVFSMLLMEVPLEGTKLRIADVAIIELPQKKVPTYRKGQGGTFHGGPGSLPMRVETVATDEEHLVVETTGARYTFGTKANTISCEQRLERERVVTIWKASAPLEGLEVSSRTATECILANDHLTFGVQCDSLLMVIPHEEVVLICESQIDGRWNRLAYGHLLIVDDLGGFAVNPDIPLGSGRPARVHLGEQGWRGIKPGRRKPGEIDFANTSDNQTFLSKTTAPWSMRYHLSPGERLGISVFPPRPFPWKKSFQFAWLLAQRDDPLDHYRARKRGDEHVEILWSFLQRAWAMSWGSEHVPYDEELTHAHIRAIHDAGSKAIFYGSPQWYYSRDAQEWANELRRLKDHYGIDGIYYDGIPSQEWIVAYEEMRLTREIFPDGPVILHNTGQCYNGNPPLGEPALRIPAIETYATATLAGELVYGEGTDWPFIRYSASQYRKANCIGAMKGDAWEGVSDHEKAMTMLLHNGRGQYRKFPAEYYRVLQKLEGHWQEHGNEPEFYERYFVPTVEEAIER